MAEMSTSSKIFCGVLSGLFFLTVLLFFGIGYPYHVCFQEQYQLFEWTREYFFSVVSVPGGLSDWVGRFLVQFFIKPWPGAAIIAICLVAVQFSCWKIAFRRTMVSYVLSFLPSGFLFIFLLDDKAMMGAVVSLISVLLAVMVVSGVDGTRSGNILSFVLIPILYYFSGPVSVVFVLLSMKRLGLLPGLIALSVWAACPLLLQFVLHYQLKGLVVGIHYIRYLQTFASWFWLSAAMVVIYFYLTVLIREEMAASVQYVAGGAATAAIAVTVVMISKGKADFEKEELMGYDNMVRFERWDEVLRRNAARPADKPLSVSCVNLALARTSGLGNSMFHTFQSGTEGLFPKFTMNYSSPLPTSEIFWHLGMLSACQYYTFEAQEAIPDFQKSARCYKRLAQISMKSGDFDIAEKYAGALANTLFYRKWAVNAALSVGRDAAVSDNSSSCGGQALECSKDVWFKDSGIDLILEQLASDNPGNNDIYEYLSAWSLLKNDLESFVNRLRVDGKPVPVHFQEAYLLYMIDRGGKMEQAPSFVDSDVSSRMLDFIKDLKAGKNTAYMRNHYGDTYWFYSLYR